MKNKLNYKLNSDVRLQEETYDATTRKKSASIDKRFEVVAVKICSSNEEKKLLDCQFRFIFPVDGPIDLVD